MKLNLFKFAALVAIICGVLSCKEDIEPATMLSVEFVSSDETSVTLNVLSEGLSNYALLAVLAEEDTEVPAPSAVMSDSKSVKGSLTGGTTPVTISNLTHGSDYTFYVAGEDSNGKLYQHTPYIKARTVLGKTLSAEVTSVESFLINLSITSTKLAKYAILTVPAKDDTSAPAADLIFAEGITGELVSGTSVDATITGLLPLTDYNIYIAAADEQDDLFENVVTINTTTADCTDELTIYNIGKDHATITVKLPESVKEAENLVGWAYMSLPQYVMFQQYGQTDPDFIQNAAGFGMFFDSDHTFSISLEDSIYEDEEGFQDQLYMAPVPGEPGILMMAEMTPDGEILFDSEKYNEDNGGGGGWWDDDDWGMLSTRASAVEIEDEALAPYWKGFHHKVRIDFEKPDEFDADFDVNLNITPKGGQINVEAGDNVSAWTFALYDEYTYYQLLEMVNGEEDLAQWFITSQFAYTLGLAYSLEGSYDLDLEDFIWPEPDVEYHFLAVALGDERGHKQKFIHEVFTLPEATMPAPEVEITAIDAPADASDESRDPAYNVWFNVRCTTGNATEAYYSCEYEKDFMPYANALGLDEMLQTDSYRNSFSASDIAHINSAEGLNIGFPSIPDMTTVCAFIAYNEEGTPSAAVMDKKRTSSANVERVESSLFKSLEGDWTATAKVHIYSNDWNWEINDYVVTDKDVDITTKVTLGGFTYPELGDDVYNAYEGMDKDDVRSLYNEFTSFVDGFNERTRNMNRILGQGFEFDDTSANPYYTPAVFQSAYDLFTSSTYSGYNVEATVLDAGPKWYLEVAKDGSVSMPYSVTNMLPASSHYAYYGSTVQTHIAGCSYDRASHQGEISYEGKFPVEISADGNTITLKPNKVDGTNYYPSLWINSWGSLSCDPVVTDIVLTRGWNGESTSAAAATSTKAVSNPQAGAVSVKSDLKASNNSSVSKARTSTAKASIKPAAKKMTVKPVTADQMKASIKETLNK